MAVLQLALLLTVAANCCWCAVPPMRGYEGRGYLTQVGTGSTEQRPIQSPENLGRGEGTGRTEQQSMQSPEDLSRGEGTGRTEQQAIQRLEDTPVYGAENEFILEDSSPCTCLHQSCGCCITPKIGRILSGKRLCANISHQSTGNEVSLDLIYGDKHIFTTSVPVKNPPQKCFGVSSSIELCLNLDFKWPAGCANVVAKCYGHDLGSKKIGCFKIPGIRAGQESLKQRLPSAWERPAGVSDDYE